MAASILWYDLETFGLDSRCDRIAQFAAVRTDESLESRGERIILYCKPAPDYLPSPQSCLVHGITPQHALEAGLSEYDFARRIRAEMTAPGTAAAGFNSLQFDDEFVRNLLYRNLFDPYEREWRNGNSRWDLIDLMRAARDLRPEGLVWPEGEGGRPIFTLGALARANGVAHESAHDAMHDVLATVELARLVRARQPKLFEWYWTHRTRDSLRPLIDLVDRTPLVHTSAAYTSERGCTALVAPVSVDPENRNQLVALDLRRDVSPVVDLPVEEIRRRAFAKADEGERLPISMIRLNRCPFLAPLNALSDAAARRLGIDAAACLERQRALRSRPELIRKIAAAFEIRDAPEPSPDPELRLYAGSFLPERDAEELERAHAAIAERGAAGAKPAVYRMRFADDRPAQMLRRLYARNFPETLGPEEVERWRAFCAGRLQLPPGKGATDLATFYREIERGLAAPETPARDLSILKALKEYGSSLEKAALGYDGP